jgi:hypothetical protein
MSFKNCWMIYCSYDFQTHQQRFQWRSCFSQTALPWFEVLPRLPPALPGLLLVVPVVSPTLPGAPTCSWRSLRRSSQLCDLTTPGFWSINSLTLPEAPSDIITFCRCIPQDFPRFAIIFLPFSTTTGHGSTNTSSWYDWIQIEPNGGRFIVCAPGWDTAAKQTPVCPRQRCNCHHWKYDPRSTDEEST